MLFPSMGTRGGKSMWHAVCLLYLVSFVLALSIQTPTGLVSYASPSLGIGPAEFALIGEAHYFVHADTRCEESEQGAQYTAELSGKIAVIASSQCTAGELAEFAQRAESIAVIVLGRDLIPGSQAYSWDGVDYNGVDIPTTEMYEKDWGTRTNATVHLVPTENAWDTVHSKLQWSLFSLLFGSITVYLLIVCVQKLIIFIQVDGWRAELAQLVLGFELIGQVISILWFLNPYAIFKLWSSDVSIFIMFISFPFSITTNFMVATFYMRMLNSAGSKIHLQTWKFLCSACVLIVFSTVFLIEILYAAEVIAAGIRGLITGVVYAFFFGCTGVLLFYSNILLWYHVHHSTIKISSYIKKVNWLVFASALSTACILAATLTVTTPFFGTPAGLLFTYYIMFVGRTVLSASQIHIFNATARREKVTADRTLMTKNDEYERKPHKEAHDDAFDDEEDDDDDISDLEMNSKSESNITDEEKGSLSSPSELSDRPMPSELSDRSMPSDLSDTDVDVR